MLDSAYVLVSAFAHPYTLVASVLILATLRRRAHTDGSARRARVLPALGVCLYLLSSPLVSRAVTESLESIHPARPDADVNAVDAIVVLSGGFRRGPNGEGELAYDTMSRCVRAAGLYQTIGPLPVIVSGGILPSGPPTIPVAEGMFRFLKNFGIPEEHLIRESESTTTFENARESARLLSERGWTRVALVTSATHLPRAVAVFKNQGLDVRPVGTGYANSGVPLRFVDLLPSATAVDAINRGAHEWIGYAWYRLRGRVTSMAPERVPGTSQGRPPSDESISPAWQFESWARAEVW